MAISAKGADGVATGARGLGHRPSVVLVVVVAVVGAESGGARRQRLRRSRADGRAGQMAVGRLALVSVERAVVGRRLRRRVHGAAVVEGAVRAGADAGNDAEVASHARTLDRRQRHVRVLVVHLSERSLQILFICIQSFQSFPINSLLRSKKEENQETR